MYLVVCLVYGWPAAQAPIVLPFCLPAHCAVGVEEPRGCADPALGGLVDTPHGTVGLGVIVADGAARGCWAGRWRWV